MEVLQQVFGAFGNIFDDFVEEPHYNGAVDSQNNVPLPRCLGSSNSEKGDAALMIGSIPLTRMYLKADWTNGDQRTALAHESSELLTLE